MASLRVPRLAHPDLIIRRAANQDEIMAADLLVYRNYVAVGYWDDDLSHVTKNMWLRSPNRMVFVAILGATVVGTVSVIHDSADGLPSDSFQPGWLDYFRRRGDKLAEGSALAVERSVKGLRHLSLYLLKCYMQYSFYCTSIDRLVEACQPKHANFHADVLRFEKLGGIVYNRYARRPSQLLTIDLFDAHLALHDYYATETRSGEDNFYRFLLVDEHPNVQVPEEVTSRPRSRDWVAFAERRRTVPKTGDRLALAKQVWPTSHRAATAYL